MSTAPRKNGAADGGRHPWRVEGERPGARQARSLAWMVRRFWWVAVLLLTLNWYIGAQVAHNSSPRVSVPYTYFRQQVTAGNVAQVTSTADKIQGVFRQAVRYPPVKGESSKKFETRRPAFADDALLGLLVKRGVVVNAKPPEQARPVLLTLLVSIVPSLLIVGLLIFVMRKMVGGGGLGGLGRSRAQRYSATGKQRTTFEDVAGIDEAKEELIEIVDFLKDPSRYHALGATIPKGVLLSGMPGTGKTLLARAVAGEADVPFYSLSASEFIEMVAGVGASRVRDLFSTAKQNAPAIIFIDELDAVGRSRGGGVGSPGALDEREQTLNQILTEMDGFSGSEGVIVLASTNRPEVLDTALLRPGRFDRRIVVNPPDQAGRRKILEVHTRNVPLAPDVDPARLAAATPGMVGAELKNLVNEAALLAARRGHTEVALADFSDALEKVILGAERRITISSEQRERTAYHEAGHALLGMLEPGADPVRKVSIIPRGQALGVTLQTPVADRYGFTAEYLRGRIVGALGGRAAEALIYGNVTSGAESDLEQVTRIARQMVGRWGMSDAIGLVSVLPRPGDGVAPDAEVSSATHELVDAEVRKIVSECYASAYETLESNRWRLESMTKALLEHETLDEEAAYRSAGLDWERVTDVDPGANGSGNGDRAARVHRRDVRSRLLDD